MRACVRVCVCVCVHACVCVCVCVSARARASVCRACKRASVRACLRAYVYGLVRPQKCRSIMLPRRFLHLQNLKNICSIFLTQ